ncbi:MAG: hypothetical protein K8R21_15770 [Leptospira sp.]|nr:hypothetical protein [Leptospira sp.]
MKDKLAFTLIILLSVPAIYSDGNTTMSSFSHPLRIQPAAVYTKVRADAVADENRDGTSYSRDRAMRIEGEYKITGTISVNSSMGQTLFEKSKSEPIRENDRLNLGMRYAKEVPLPFGTIVFGGGLQLFNARSDKAPKRDTENPTLYLVRPQASFGLRMGSFEIQSELRFQGETNPSLHEKYNEEFRRYFQGGLSLSYGLSESFRVFMETEYRHPYNRKVDTETRFWNAYPGFSYRITQKTIISASVLVPIALEKYSQDRGIRLSVFYFF